MGFLLIPKTCTFYHYWVTRIEISQKYSNHSHAAAFFPV